MMLFGLLRYFRDFPIIQRGSQSFAIPSLGLSVTQGVRIKSFVPDLQ